MINRSSPKVLIVDDDPSALLFTIAQLKSQNYQITSARSGEEAWELLESSPENYNLVILDRIMPGMRGMEVLIRMKSHRQLKKIPVIFQTSMDEENEILEGLQAGVNYYLTKPCKKEMLVAVVKAALSNYLIYNSIREDVRQWTDDAILLMKKGCFEVQTPEHGRKLATLLATLCPEPEKTALGLWELLLNAIEHGNLGISYEQKSHLIETDQWHDEVERRLQLAENIIKKVVVEIENTDHNIRFFIQDQGQGFDWKPFMELSAERAFDAHGRGIVFCRRLIFDEIKYYGNGNEVSAVIYK